VSYNTLNTRSSRVLVVDLATLTSAGRCVRSSSAASLSQEAAGDQMAALCDVLAGEEEVEEEEEGR